MQIKLLDVNSADGLNSSAEDALESHLKQDHDTTGISKLADSSGANTSGSPVPQDPAPGLHSHPLNQERSVVLQDSQRPASNSGIPYPPQFYEQDGIGAIRNSDRGNNGTSGLSRPLLGQQSTTTATGKREFHDSKDLEQALHAVFLQFARFGNRSDSQHLDSFRFMKLCRECCLTTELGDTQCVDLIFYQEKKGSSGHLCAVFQNRPSHFLGSIVKDEKSKEDAFKMYSKVSAS